MDQHVQHLLSELEMLGSSINGDQSVKPGSSKPGSPKIEEIRFEGLRRACEALMDNEISALLSSNARVTDSDVNKVLTKMFHQAHQMGMAIFTKDLYVRGLELIAAVPLLSTKHEALAAKAKPVIKLFTIWTILFCSKQRALVFSPDDDQEDAAASSLSSQNLPASRGSGLLANKYLLIATKLKAVKNPFINQTKRRGTVLNKGIVVKGAHHLPGGRQQRGNNRNYDGFFFSNRRASVKLRRSTSSNLDPLNSSNINNNEGASPSPMDRLSEEYSVERLLCTFAFFQTSIMCQYYRNLAITSSSSTEPNAETTICNQSYVETVLILLWWIQKVMELQQISNEKGVMAISLLEVSSPLHKSDRLAHLLLESYDSHLFNKDYLNKNAHFNLPESTNHPNTFQNDLDRNIKDCLERYNHLEIQSLPTAPSPYFSFALNRAKTAANASNEFRKSLASQLTSLAPTIEKMKVPFNISSLTNTEDNIERAHSPISSPPSRKLITAGQQRPDSGTTRPLDDSSDASIAWFINPNRIGRTTSRCSFRCMVVVKRPSATRTNCNWSDSIVNDSMAYLKLSETVPMNSICSQLPLTQTSSIDIDTAGLVQTLGLAVKVYEWTAVVLDCLMDSKITTMKVYQRRVFLSNLLLGLSGGCRGGLPSAGGKESLKWDDLMGTYVEGLVEGHSIGEVWSNERHEEMVSVVEMLSCCCGGVDCVAEVLLQEKRMVQLAQLVKLISSGDNSVLRPLKYEILDFLMAMASRQRAVATFLYILVMYDDVG